MPEVDDVEVELNPNDLEISNLGIELKTEIEKIREQIQNIE